MRRTLSYAEINAILRKVVKRDEFVMYGPKVIIMTHHDNCDEFVPAESK